MSLDQFVAMVHDKSSKSPDAIATAFRKNKSLDLCSMSAISNACKALDPNLFPVGHGCVLSLACAHNSKHRDADCRASMTAFLEACDPAAFKVIPAETAAICRALVADTMQDAALAEAVLPTLLKALRKMQPSKEHMTPCHAAVLQASVKCKRYALGRQLLDEEIYCLCDTGLIASDYLLYYYYGGLVCAALKEHAYALKLFEMAITIPTAVPDAIIVAAWHRYQIITALSKGHAATFPRHASPACKNGRSSTGRESEVVGLLVKAYLGNKRAALETLMKDEHAYIRGENLTGLVAQMHDQMTTHAIRKMTATYMTLPLAAIASEAGLQGPEQAAKHVFKMIAAGDVNAVIDEGAGMVKFQESGEGALVSLEALQERIGKVADMQRRLVEAARAVRLENKYVGHLLRQDFAAGAAGPSSASPQLAVDAGVMAADAMDDS
eukprot:jgi/Ulvmu1/5259/UM022_0053.1